MKRPYSREIVDKLVEISGMTRYHILDRFFPEFQIVDKINSKEETPHLTTAEDLRERFVKLDDSLEKSRAQIEIDSAVLQKINNADTSKKAQDAYAWSLASKNTKNQEAAFAKWARLSKINLQAAESVKAFNLEYDLSPQTIKEDPKTEDKRKKLLEHELMIATTDDEYCLLHVEATKKGREYPEIAEEIRKKWTDLAVEQVKKVKTLQELCQIRCPISFQSDEVKKIIQRRAFDLCETADDVEIAHGLFFFKSEEFDLLAEKRWGELIRRDFDKATNLVKKIAVYESIPNEKADSDEAAIFVRSECVRFAKEFIAKADRGTYLNFELLKFSYEVFLIALEKKLKLCETLEEVESYIKLIREYSYADVGRSQPLYHDDGFVRLRDMAVKKAYELL